MPGCWRQGSPSSRNGASYQAHATVIRILSQAEVVGLDAWEDGLKYLFRMADAISMGMPAGAAGGRDGADERISGTDSRLSAVACLIMLERANYLASSGVQLPRAELVDRPTAIVMGAFQAPGHPP